MKNVRSLIEEGYAHDFLFFWGHTEKSDKVTKACLSQWYEISFFEDGVFYNSAEQYMMTAKASLMSDHETLAKILRANDPKEIKALGRVVKNFNAALWDRHKLEIVVKGNLLKFGQNPLLQEFLLSTGDKVLVEASPYDKVWGIGLSANNPDALHPERWQGENLLGFALMEVRDRLREEAKPKTIQCGVTPENIQRLKPEEVFVFGSNLAGVHGGGAARYARKHFGAVMGVGVGMQGQSYAIPTMQGGVETIKPYVDQFIEFVRHNPRKHFLVTKIGCGIAGFKVEQIASLFAKAIEMPNVSLPQEFIDVIAPQPQEPTKEEMQALWMWKNGLGNMARAFNGEDPMPSKEVVATRDSWKTLPFPKEHITVDLHFEIPADRMEVIKRGHIPDAMEDHWFMYCTKDTIRYYRSWTGLCIFVARYKTIGDKAIITQLSINNKEGEYQNPNTSAAVNLFLALVVSEAGGDASSFWDKAMG